MKGRTYDVLKAAGCSNVHLVPLIDSEGLRRRKQRSNSADRRRDGGGNASSVISDVLLSAAVLCLQGPKQRREDE